MRSTRTADPDRAKFSRGRLVILATIVLLAGAGFLVPRVVQDQTAAAFIVIALLVVLVWVAGRMIQRINRSVDDRYREIRAANSTWAASIGGRFETTAPLPPAEIRAITFAEDRRVIVPVSASEVVRGEWRGHAFVAMHLSGYEKLRPGAETKGRDASTNLVYLTLPHELPDLRILDGSVAHDYGRPMTAIDMRHLDSNSAWRVESDDLSRSTALMGDEIRALLNASSGRSMSVAATGCHLICYGDPVGDADAIVAQLELLTALAERIPHAAWLGPSST